MKLAKTFVAILYINLCFACVSQYDQDKKNETDDIMKSKFNIGYRILDFEYKEKEEKKTLTVAVWYPTTADPKKYKYGNSGLEGNVAEDAIIIDKDKKYPFLVFSHGHGGGGISNLFFTEYMASLGWIVAAPDYPDKHQWARIRGAKKKSLAEFQKELKEAMDLIHETNWKEKFPYRPQVFKLTLDKMLDCNEFGSNIDNKKIAVAGHSLGGFTSLSVSGVWDDYTDERVKAMIVMSGARMFEPKDFKKIKIPTMYMYGEKEADSHREGKDGKTTQGEAHVQAYKHSPSPSFLLEVKGGTHFAFNNSREKLFGGTKEQHEVIKLYGAAFLQLYVTGDKKCEKIIKEKDSRLTKFDSK